MSKLSLLNETNDIKNRKHAYLNYLSNLTLSIKNKKILESIKPLILNYFHVRAWGQLNFQGADSNTIKLIIDTLDQLFPYFIKAYDDDSDLAVEIKSILDEMLTEIITEINYASFLNIKFCNKFVELKGLKVLFNYLNEQRLVDFYVVNSKNQQSKSFDFIHTIMKTTIGCLVCLARTYNNYKNEWKECNSVKNFLTYLSNTKEILDQKIYATLAISFVADDEDVDKLPELKDHIPELTKIIGMASKSIKDNLDLVRDFLQIDDDEDDKEVCLVFYLGTEWSLINLIKGLYHLAVNDKLKYDIYYKNNMNKHSRLLIYFANDIEKEYTLNLLWQLCFDKQIAEDVYNDKEFYDFIKNLSNDPTCSQGVAKCSKGIIWIINKKLNLSNDSANEESLESLTKKNTANKLIHNLLATVVAKDTNKHVMISYNRDSRDMCLAVKSEIEKLNLKVWIDIEDISGSSLESMANAIENSVCVLMCMTEKYKQSPNCRAEAEYAFQLSKPIIPLIMQKDYKPDGWLGIILGSKIFVNFTRYEFNECIRRLKLELDGVLKNKQSSQINDTQNSKSLTNKEKDVNEIVIDSAAAAMDQKKISKVTITNIQDKLEYKWTEKDVDSWFKKMDIHPNILSNVRPCDGQILYEIYLIKQESPEFFYRSLAASYFKKPVLLRDLAMFSNELRKLFD